MDYAEANMLTKRLLAKAMVEDAEAALGHLQDTKLDFQQRIILALEVLLSDAIQARKDHPRLPPYVDEKTLCEAVELVMKNEDKAREMLLPGARVRF